MTFHRQFTLCLHLQSHLVIISLLTVATTGHNGLAIKVVNEINNEYTHTTILLTLAIKKLQKLN